MVTLILFIHSNPQKITVLENDAIYEGEEKNAFLVLHCKPPRMHFAFSPS